MLIVGWFSQLVIGLSLIKANPNPKAFQLLNFYYLQHSSIFASLLKNKPNFLTKLNQFLIYPNCLKHTNIILFHTFDDSLNHIQGSQTFGLESFFYQV